MFFKSFNKKDLRITKNGGVGIIPTDTIYGLVGTALNKKTVERIYKLRHRNQKKPMIILIGDINDLRIFGIKLKIKAWPPKTSIIFPAPSAKFRYLHRGSRTLAFRFPRPKKIRDFLNKTGPLVTPSANIEGQPPAKTIKEAQKYFGDKIDFYVDGGRLNKKPSKLIKFNKDRLITIRN